jgi:hypothetical protein
MELKLLPGPRLSDVTVTGSCAITASGSATKRLEDPLGASDSDARPLPLQAEGIVREARFSCQCAIVARLGASDAAAAAGAEGVVRATVRPADSDRPGFSCQCAIVARLGASDFRCPKFTVCSM